MDKGEKSYSYPNKCRQNICWNLKWNFLPNKDFLSDNYSKHHSSRWKFWGVLLKSGTRQKCPHQLFFPALYWSPIQCNKKKKGNKMYKFWKGRNKTDIFIDNVIVYLENTKDYKLLELNFKSLTMWVGNINWLHLYTTPNKQLESIIF